MTHTLYKIFDDLFLVAFNSIMPGYDNFLSAWIYMGAVTFIVDPGPSVALGELVKALAFLGVNRLDYILLTHIHIDHTGAVGDLCVLFPEAKVVCHSQGISYLGNSRPMDPRPEEASGEIALHYRSVSPVSEVRLLEAETFMSNSVMPLPTPGYASHHVSYYTDRYLFIGDAGGVCFPGVMGISYMRPSTPPPFSFDISIQSLEDLMEFNSHRICYGHFGSFESGARVLWQHREQLRLWDSIVTSEIRRGLVGSELEVSVLKTILEKDPLVLLFLDMEGALRLRELFFLEKSIRGFIGNTRRHLCPLS